MRKYKNTYQQYQKRQNRHSHRRSLAMRTVSVAAAAVIFLSSFGYNIPIQASAEEQAQETTADSSVRDVTENSSEGADKDSAGTSSGNGSSDTQDTSEHNDSKAGEDSKSGNNDKSGDDGNSEAGHKNGVKDSAKNSNADAGTDDTDADQADKGNSEADEADTDDTEADESGTNDTEADASDTDDTEADASDTDDTEADEADTDDTEADEADTDDTEADEKDKDDLDETISSVDWSGDGLQVNAEGTFPKGTRLQVSTSREDLAWTYTITYENEEEDNDVTLAEPAHVRFSWDDPAAPSATDDNGTTNEDNERISYAVQAYVNGEKTDADYDGRRIAGLSFDSDDNSVTVRVVWTRKLEKIEEEKAPTELNAELDDVTNALGQKGKIRATLTADEGVLPKGAELKLNPLTPDNEDTKDLYAKITDQTADQLQGEDQTLTGVLTYDVFLEVDGEKQEPKGDVQLTLDWEDADGTPAATDDKEDGDWENSKVSVLHVHQNQNNGDIDAIDNLTKKREDNSDEDWDSLNNVANVVTETVSRDENAEKITAVKKAEIKVDSLSPFVLAWTKAAAKETKSNKNKLTATTADGVYRATVTFNEASGIRPDYSLSINELTEEDTDYSAVKSAVESALNISEDNGNADTFGFAALDITLHDENGIEFEPNTREVDGEKPEVSLKIEVLQLPDGLADDGTIRIQHLTKQNNIIAQAMGLVRRLVRRAPAAPQTTFSVEQIPGEGVVNDGQASMEFYLNQFSVFTITWTKAGTSTRIGSIRVRYVDENGLEIETSKSFSDAELKEMAETEGGIVDLSDWANNEDGSSRVDGYTYDRAAIGSRDGRTVTGLKVVRGTQTRRQRTDDGGGTPAYENVEVTVYQLYYTADAEVTADGSWTLYRDPESENGANNANVYLFYSNVKAPVTIHFLDTDGNAIQDADGEDIIRTIDAADHTSEYDLAVYAQNNAPEGYRFSTSNMNSANAGTNKIILEDTAGSATIGSVKGDYYRYLKYENNTVRMARGDKSYHDVTAPVNIYISYNHGGIVIHHVDTTGTQLAADTTQTLPDKTSWDGYSNALNSSSAPYHVNNIGTYAGSYIGFFGNAAYSNTRGGQTLNGIYYKHEANGTWHTGLGTSTSSVTREMMGENGKPALLYDIYQEYTGYKGVVIHHVDEDGNAVGDDTYTAVRSGNSLDPSSQKNTSLTGYTYEAAHTKSYAGPVFSSITYTQQGTDWNNAVAYTEEGTTDQELVNEIWLVYTKGAITKQITLHYQYLNQSGEYSNAYYNDNPANTTATFTVTSGKDNYLVTDPTQYGAYVPTIYDGHVMRPAVTANGETAPQPLVYMSSHLAAGNGPTVTYVTVGSDGDLIYHTSMEGTADPDTSSADPTSWTLSEPTGAQRGRSIVISRTGDGNLQLRDSLNGDIVLNLANDAAENSNGIRVGESYQATFHNEDYTVEYTVTPDTYTRTGVDGSTTSETRYGIEVVDSYKSSSTDVYQVYTDGSNNEDKLWVEDDMKYSGLFRTGVSDSLDAELRHASNISYRWHRISVSSAKDVPSQITAETNANYEVVLRKHSGEHWNIALDPDEATWLDIEAEEGTQVWGKGTTHAFYVELTYTPQGSSTPVSVYSKPVTVNYYGELENGSFEDVTPEKQYSNEDYAAAGGVWQTTGPGSTRSSRYTGRDIEIVDGRNHSNLLNSNAYHWQPTDEEQTKPNGSWAREGNYFAELNAENAGALYQDVITHPNENINFWLSHRARGSSEADKDGYQYDTMYVVIMPTRLAMTMGSNGGELRTQTDLEAFINSRGGFDRSEATEETGQLTFYDEDSGILIYKVSSDENGWHDVSVVNNYKAKGGLTRFFFCAASTAGDLGRNQEQHLSDPPTIGNFIDNVGFSQSLPPTTGFNLTVTETFSGLTMEQVAGLASNAADYRSRGITRESHPLAVTVTNSRNENEHTASNDALNGASLGFTISYDAENNLVFTPTAVRNGVDLLGSSSSRPGTSSVRQYEDGRIVITWAFPNQILAESSGESTDRTYTYYANDNQSSTGGARYSTTDVQGYTKTSSGNAVDNNGQNGSNVTQGRNSDGAVRSSITVGSDKTLNLINVYSPSAHISVRKTFYGATPATVREIMQGTDGKDPYQIIITRGSGAGAASKVLRLNGGYSADGKAVDNTVSVTSSQGRDGSTTYKWTISDPDWQNGTYTIQECNYTTNRNTLSDIRLNGESVAVDGQWPSSNAAVTVSDGTTAVMNYSPTYSQENHGVVRLPGGTLPDTAMHANTNLVVGQYTLTSSDAGAAESGNTASSGTKRYVVWSGNEIGLITRRAIIAQINEIWDEDDSHQATMSNTSFYTGDDVYVVTDGRIARMIEHQSASLTGLAWDKVYAAHMSAASDGRSVDESEVRLDNYYVPKIKIQKQSTGMADEGGTTYDVLLNGAVFRLYKFNGNTKLYYQDNAGATTEADLWKPESLQGAKPKEYTTAKDAQMGDGIAILRELPADDNTVYYLEEYAAPSGYQKIDDVAFKVKSNGTVTLVDGDGAEQTSLMDGAVRLTFIDPYYTLIINDAPGYSLPQTGGGGTIPFLLGGTMMLLLSAGGWLWLRRCRFFSCSQGRR